MSHPRCIEHTQTGQCVDSVNVHGAASTNALSATSPEGQSWVDLVLDANQRVQHHGSRLVQIEGVGLHARLLRGLIGIPPVDLEGLGLCVGVEGRLLCIAGLAGGDHWCRRVLRPGGVGGDLASRGHGAAEDLRRKAPCCES